MDLAITSVNNSVSLSVLDKASAQDNTEKTEIVRYQGDSSSDANFDGKLYMFAILGDVDSSTHLDITNIV